jgi:hypothetical protein
MKKLIQKITPAIMKSRKIKVRTEDGNKYIVHPHIVIRKKLGNEILKSVLESGDCIDIPLEKITGISILPESFAIDSACLRYDYGEYELVFPRREDLFEGMNEKALPKDRRK